MEPPTMAATLTLPPPGRRPSGSAVTISAATAIALTPASGLAAACAARPWTANANDVWPSARVMTVPTGLAPSTEKAQSTRSSSSGASRPAPILPLSSQQVKAAWTVGRRASGSCAAAAQTRITAATAALLSAPRIVSPSERMTPSSPMCGVTAGMPDSTVSMWATNRYSGASGAPGTVATRLPASEPLTAPASSNWAATPWPASHSRMSSPTTRSRRLGDGTATSSRNSSVADASRVRGTRGRLRGLQQRPALGEVPAPPALQPRINRRRRLRGDRRRAQLARQRVGGHHVGEHGVVELDRVLVLLG